MSSKYVNWQRPEIVVNAKGGAHFATVFCMATNPVNTLQYQAPREILVFTSRRD
jgi:hypothetical protein